MKSKAVHRRISSCLARLVFVVVVVLLLLLLFNLKDLEDNLDYSFSLQLIG